MAITAKLKIQLLADNVLVAESEDARLWQSAFAAISAARSVVPTETEAPLFGEAVVAALRPAGRTPRRLNSFADELGVTVEQLDGACGPSRDAPYLHLDVHCWEALKRNNGTRGPNSIAPISLAATMLCLWFRHAGNEKAPTVADCHAVLRPIGVDDKNASRSLKNCTWIQSRGSGLIVNPAQISRAIEVAKAFCLRTPVSAKE